MSERPFRHRFCGEQSHTTRHDRGTLAATSRRIRHSARASPFLGCFIGTFSPSRRHRRSMRLSFTCQPASLSKAAIRRYPYRPYCRTSSTMSANRRSSSARPLGLRRCVERCWPRTRQIRRSDTFSSLCYRSMQTRRRAGLRSFPWQPHSGSTCPASGPKRLF